MEGHSLDKKYGVEDLVYLMQRLREPEFGCPWDQKQDFDSIVPFTIEECYEVVDAIEQQDWQHLSEELGDLLFQIIFYAQLGDENNLFDLTDIVHQLVAKLIRRHPHVFPNQELMQKRTMQLSEQEIADSWEEIKRQEREEKGEQQRKNVSILDDIPMALPSLQRAYKLQKRAAKVGFDWHDVLPVIDKMEEELQELRAAITTGVASDIQDEMGDVLFSQVNLARHLGVKADEALRLTNKKFTRRFSYVEERVEASNKTWQQYTLDQLDQFWDEAKSKGL